MSQQHEPAPGDAERMSEVDADPRAHQATEADETAVLDRLYGPPDAGGFYQGECA